MLQKGGEIIIKCLSFFFFFFQQWNQKDVLKKEKNQTYHLQGEIKKQNKGRHVHMIFFPSARNGPKVFFFFFSLKKFQSRTQSSSVFLFSGCEYWFPTFPNGCFLWWHKHSLPYFIFAIISDFRLSKQPGASGWNNACSWTNFCRQVLNTSKAN